VCGALKQVLLYISIPAANMGVVSYIFNTIQQLNASFDSFLCVSRKAALTLSTFADQEVCEVRHAFDAVRPEAW